MHGARPKVKYRLLSIVCGSAAQIGPGRSKLLERIHDTTERNDRFSSAEIPRRVFGRWLQWGHNRSIISRRPATRWVDARPRRPPLISGPPLAFDEPAGIYERASDEHGKLGTPGAINRLNIGDDPPRPSYCDPTVNLHDWSVRVRAGRVE